MNVQLSLNLMQGAFAENLSDVKLKLIKLIAYIEAFLDFPEEDMPDQDESQIVNELQYLIDAGNKLKSKSSASKHLRDGISIVIMGPANAGKSSLFNSILGKERSIVSHHAGTTRDFIDAEIIHDGLLVRLIDTAGLRDESREIEKVGQIRGFEQGKSADMVLFIVDGTKKLDESVEYRIKGITKYHSNIMIIRNKRDLSDFIAKDEINLLPGDMQFNISAMTGEAVDVLMGKIYQYFLKNESKVDDKWLLSNRQQSLVDDMCDNIKKAEQAYREKMSQEFVASDLKLALQSIESILGESLSDSVLDEIFSRFCIGK